MISFPNAKINLGLEVLSKREDGYHMIESVFYPVNFCDALEIIPQHEKTAGNCDFSSSGLEIPGIDEDNLCVKAYHILSRHKTLPAVKIHLHKVVPMGAGLGGGSADGSFTLKTLDTLFQLNLGNGKLKEYAAELGSDCPFFIDNQPSEVSGRGEKLIPSRISLRDYHIVILDPQIHISTTEAFKNSSFKSSKSQVFSGINKRPVEKWKDFLRNDFEEYVFQKHPVIAELKENLYKAGAIYTSMTGSGSAIYGLFSEKIALNDKLANRAVYTGKF